MKTITKSALAAAVLGALMLSAAPTTVMAAAPRAQPSSTRSRDRSAKSLRIPIALRL